MRAVGAYLRALRAQQGISQGRLTELVGVAGNTIWRIEAGDQEPRAGQFAAILTALHGRIEDIQRLITDTAATPADGEALAGHVLGRSGDSLIALADSDERRIRLLKRIAQLTENPELRARIEGYLDGLEAAE